MNHLPILVPGADYPRVKPGAEELYNQFTRLCDPNLALNFPAQEPEPAKIAVYGLGHRISSQGKSLDIVNDPARPRVVAILNRLAQLSIHKEPRMPQDVFKLLGLTDVDEYKISRDINDAIRMSLSYLANLKVPFLTAKYRRRIFVYYQLDPRIQYINGAPDEETNNLLTPERAQRRSRAINTDRATIEALADKDIPCILDHNGKPNDSSTSVKNTPQHSNEAQVDPSSLLFLEEPNHTEYDVPEQSDSKPFNLEPKADDEPKAETPESTADSEPNDKSNILLSEDSVFKKYPELLEQIQEIKLLPEDIELIIHISEVIAACKGFVDLREIIIAHKISRTGLNIDQIVRLYTEQLPLINGTGLGRVMSCTLLDEKHSIRWRSPKV